MKPSAPKRAGNVPVPPLVTKTWNHDELDFDENGVLIIKNPDLAKAIAIHMEKKKLGTGQEQIVVNLEAGIKSEGRRQMTGQPNASIVALRKPVDPPLMAATETSPAGVVVNILCTGGKP